MVLLFGYAPVLLTIGPAAIAAKAIIWLTLFVMAPFVSVLWRTRRKLADATAIQLTRYPAALAEAYRTLAGLDMKVPGAVEVHFLFPVWDPAVDLDQTRQDVTSAVMHLQLPLEPRLRRLERLGARADGATLAISDPGYTWLEVAQGRGLDRPGCGAPGRGDGAERGGRGGDVVRARMAAAQGAGGVPAAGRGAVELRQAVVIDELGCVNFIE